ncbi:MAG: TIGR03905 family TSCPD domain-containing protein [Clostridia bacterium]|nr:TIGR03905 family TSCPD domain-containing protein [Clostridia bacterium]
MTKSTVYYPKGVCSRKYEITTEDGVIKSINIEGGCSGNLAGISKLLVGMEISDAISRMEGTTCGLKPTSCPDQISQALKTLI